MNKEKKLLFKISDIGFLIKWSYPQMINAAEYYYRGFVNYDKLNAAKKTLKDIYNVRVHWARNKDVAELMPPAQVLFTIPKHWTLYQNEKHYIMDVFHPHAKLRLSLGLVSKDFKEIDYYLFESDNFDKSVYGMAGEDIWLLPRLIQPLLRSVLVNILANESGGMMHSCAVKIGNQGLAFSGYSGSGKTTLAGFFRRYKDTRVLTDENVVIKRSKRDFYVYGTPWPGGGRIAHAGFAPIKNICFIRHGRKNCLTPINAASAYKKLLPQANLCVWDGRRLSSLLNFIQEMSKRINFYDLEFTNDKEVVRFLRRELIED